MTEQELELIENDVPDDFMPEGDWECEECGRTFTGKAAVMVHHMPYCGDCVDEGKHKGSDDGLPTDQE